MIASREHLSPLESDAIEAAELRKQLIKAHETKGGFDQMRTLALLSVHPRSLPYLIPTLGEILSDANHNFPTDHYLDILISMDGDFSVNPIMKYVSTTFEGSVEISRKRIEIDLLSQKGKNSKHRVIFLDSGENDSRGKLARLREATDALISDVLHTNYRLPSRLVMLDHDAHFFSRKKYDYQSTQCGISALLDDFDSREVDALAARQLNTSFSSPSLTGKSVPETRAIISLHHLLDNYLHGRISSKKGLIGAGYVLDSSLIATVNIAAHNRPSHGAEDTLVELLLKKMHCTLQVSDVRVTNEVPALFLQKELPSSVDQWMLQMIRWSGTTYRVLEEYGDADVSFKDNKDKMITLASLILAISELFKREFEGGNNNEPLARIERLKKLIRHIFAFRSDRKQISDKAHILSKQRTVTW